MKYDIFVSYRRADRELVASVVRRLETRGVAVWYDAEIEGGADWREVIVEALTNSDMLVIFFSDDANNSRQLKKELAVADTLGKAVVPILIEDTRPRGAYLYELADRNWIQAFPDPMEKIDELVEHLTTLAGKNGLLGQGTATAKVAANDAGPSGAGPAPQAAAAPAPASAAPEPASGAEQPLTEAVEEFIAGAYESKSPPPKIARAYVGHVGAGGKPIKKLNDILPFKWIDLLFLAPLVGLWEWSMLTVGMATNSGSQAADIAAHVIVALIPVALYGALVFPVRYYLRKRPVLHALTRYLLSSFILYAVMMAGLLVLKALGVLPYDNPGELAAVFGAFWIAFTLIAFVIYGVLAGQRAIRSFRSNIRKL